MYKIYLPWNHLREFDDLMRQIKQRELIVAQIVKNLDECNNYNCCINYDPAIDNDLSDLYKKIDKLFMGKMFCTCV